MTKRAKVSVGSRISPLSVVQTEEVLAQLRVRFPEYEFLVVPITTSGDRQKDVPLLDLGRGSFVKEVELALLSGEIDHNHNHDLLREQRVPKYFQGFEVVLP